MIANEPTEDEVKTAYDIVSRMVIAAYTELKTDSVDLEDCVGLVEGKRQILRYAIRRFGDGTYDRFTADD